MAIQRQQLLEYFNQLLVPQNFDDYCPNGLQIEGKSELRKLAFAVSATRESITAATRAGADALIVHHGVLWKYNGARPVTGAWGERVRQCVKHDLNLIAYHLPLDAQPEVGNACALARAIGLTNTAPFGLMKKNTIGAMGELPRPIRASELKKQLEQLLKHPVILASPDETQEIRTMGIITGGANNEWALAHEEGLDAYLTGEISEYNWHDAREAGLHYFAGGHHATERFGIIALMERVHADLGIEVLFFDSENPA